MLQTQGDERLRLDRMAGHDAQPTALGNGRQDKLRLGHGKHIADALAWPATKREISKARAAL